MRHAKKTQREKKRKSKENRIVGSSVRGQDPGPTIASEAGWYIYKKKRNQNETQITCGKQLKFSNEKKTERNRNRNGPNSKSSLSRAMTD